jgi:hypothetical protein
MDGLQGQGLSSADRLWVLDTCGVLTAVARFAWSGQTVDIGAVSTQFSWTQRPSFYLPAHNSSGEVNASLNVSNVTAWDGEFITAEGGQYRLCWCSGQDGALGQNLPPGAACISSADFVVDVGSMSVIGHILYSRIGHA